MLHIALHFIVPTGLALLFFREVWRLALALMLSGMIIDLDHLLADPIYDPMRCSIGFHPLHSEMAIIVYALLFFFSLPHALGEKVFKEYRFKVNLVAIGLTVHIVLDALDCVL